MSVINQELATFYTEFDPIIYVHFHSTKLNEQNYENYKRNYLEQLVLCKRNKKKVIFIFDINEFETLPIPYLLKQAQFNKSIQNHNKEFVNGVFIYCKNKTFKNIIKFYLSVDKNPVPVKICRSVSKIDNNIKSSFKLNSDFGNILKSFENKFMNNSQLITNNIENIDNDNMKVDENILKDLKNIQEIKPDNSSLEELAKHGL